MALRGKKPEAIQKRLKALFYGPPGVGKTTAAIQFPKPYLIDTEKGAENNQYIKILEEQGGAIFQTCDFNELITEIKSLLTERHDYKTLVIDPLTTIYNDLLDKSALKHGTDFGRHYNDANKCMKQLCSLLLRLDMNVIITSHSKNEYGNNMAIIGQTFDCYKKLDYLFDLVFEVQKRADNRVALVKKSRIETFQDGESFPFDYENVAKKYGIEIIEKESEAEILATKEQISEFIRLTELIKLPDNTIAKWLERSNSESINDMNTEIIQKCIDMMKSKVNGETKGDI